MNYSIGITTYSYRFNKFLINLVEQIRNSVNNEIILGINGNYKEEFDEIYRKKILCLMSEHIKIFPFIYPNFRSLAKIWNNIVINSSNEYVLILNDDTTIEDKQFFDVIQKNIDEHKTSFEINGKFCCFVIKRRELCDSGWFDERFLGIGWEDTEFRDRYFKFFGKPLLDIKNIAGYKAHIDWENVVVNQKRGGGKYSAFNEEMFRKQKDVLNQYPVEKFYWENKENL